MSEHYFDQLESHIVELLERCQTLEQENQQLRTERSRLLEVNALTRHRVEAMIQRLKSLEHKQ
ncbi:MAG: DUF904 domain-containing protein [Marinobacterium sp.]|nr:DUF904 domain-containing protein [Marinobacterium sp.]